jgi:hypothetical protein
VRPTLFCVTLSAMLSACASVETLPPAREVITELRVEKVPVPVPIHCVTLKDIPERPTMPPVDPGVADTRQLAAAIVAHMLGLESYAARAEIIMMQCAKTEARP